jgi:catechol 2,3-dioxygenase-like lactoylglutathione lyase family enzyme
MASRWHAVVVDASDPARLARWWAEVLGYRILEEHLDSVVVGPGERSEATAGPVLLFVLAGEDKAGRNRLHLELRPDDRDGEVERLVDMGARHVDSGQSEMDWVVLADPEGNEFCVLHSSVAAAVELDES